MKEKKIEQLSYKTIYVAADGTEFDNKDECITYDKSAIGVLKGRVKEMTVTEGTEDSIFNCGSCDNIVWVCLPKTKTDIDNIKQLLFASNAGESYVNERVTDKLIGKIVFLTICYDDYTYIYTLEDIVSRATNNQYKLEKIESPEEL